MNNNHLYVFTSTFPFEKGETFIDNEVPFWNTFDKVVIFHTGNESKLRFKLNDQIKICKLPNWNLPFSLNEIVSVIRRKEFQDEFRSILHDKQFIFKRLLTLFGWTLHGERIFNKLKGQISKDLNNGNKVFLYSYWCNSKAYGIARLKEKFNIIAISRAHGYDLYDFRSEINYLPYRRYITSTLDKIYVISNNGYEYLNKLLPNNKYKFQISRLGTNNYDVISKVPINNHKIRIVSCSYVVPVKRLHLIVETLKHIPHPVKWTHIGGGPLLTDIQELATSLPSNVECVFKGDVNQTDLYKIYDHEAFHYFINVSESEGIPVSIMEAMSVGIPVIATNVGGTSEIVDNEVNGFLISKDFSPVELATLIQNNITIGIKLRKNAINTWKNKFSAKTNFPEFFKKIKTLST